MKLLNRYIDIDNIKSIYFKIMLISIIYNSIFDILNKKVAFMVKKEKKIAGN